MIIGKEKAEKIYFIHCMKHIPIAQCPICYFKWIADNISDNNRIEHLSFHKEYERKKNGLLTRPRRMSDIL